MSAKCVVYYNAKELSVSFPIIRVCCAIASRVLEKIKQFALLIFKDNLFALSQSVKRLKSSYSLLRAV